MCHVQITDITDRRIDVSPAA